MTHRIHPSNTSELLSVEQYHILSQEFVLKVVLSLLVAPPVAPPLRTHGAAPSFAAHQSSRGPERINGVAENYSLRIFYLRNYISIIIQLLAESRKTNFVFLF